MDEEREKRKDREDRRNHDRESRKHRSSRDRHRKSDRRDEQRQRETGSTSKDIAGTSSRLSPSLSSPRRSKKSQAVGESDASSSSSIDDQSRERRKHKRKRSHSEKRDHKKRSKKHKKSERDDNSKKKKKKHRRDRQPSSSESDSESEKSSAGSPALDRNYHFADALHSLLSSHPAFASDLPQMFIRMAGGTTFDLGCMSNMDAAASLARVFESLGPFGVQKDPDGAWIWKEGGPTGVGAKRQSELVLVKLSRVLLNQIGITVDAMERFEKKSAKEEEPPTMAEDPPAPLPASKNPVQTMTEMLLSEFDKRKENDNTASATDESAPVSSFAQELAGLCNVILEGESIATGGMPDDGVRAALEFLFDKVGLEKGDISDDDEDSGDEDEEENDEQDNKSPTMGYGLPDDNSDSLDNARNNVLAIIDTCRQHHAFSSAAKEPTTKRVLGPTMPPPNGSAVDYTTTTAVFNESSDEEEGPAPLGSVMAKKRGPALPREMIKALAQNRKYDLMDAAAGNEPGSTMAASLGGQAREEWMMVPGEHDFLEGIVRSGGTLKNRTFKNEKNRGGGGSEEPAVPLNPKMQAEMDAIMKAHVDARGPSLIEQHRAKKANEKAERAAAAAMGGKGEFKWSRDKDLDEGRRVDKDALHQVLGGAATELKTKFQGSYSRGFM
uniref:DUF3752 domain-containing protein n=1 Tax=Attheya septentrionalis TaxID=420275 RepID=A0A6T7JAS5_9STRA